MSLVIETHDDRDGTTLGPEFLEWYRSIDVPNDPDPVADDGPDEGGEA